MTATMEETSDELMDDTYQMSFDELCDELDEEGLTEADLKALPEIIKQYIGFSITIKRGSQSKGWPEAMKEAAIAAVGGGESSSASMSDKLFPKGVPCIKEMGSALSELSTLKVDLFYTKPHPRTGLRRVKLGKLEEFQARVDVAVGKIQHAAQEMNDHREDIKRAARKALGARYEESFYAVDFTVIYTVAQTWTDLGVPPAIHQFLELRQKEERRVQVEGAKSIVMYKRVIAEQMQRMVDAAAFRLEQRQVLDGRHEVKFIEKSPEGNKVVYAEQKSKGKKPERTVTLTDAELEQRVTLDQRRKHWQDETMNRLIGETKRLQEAMDDIGVGGDDLTPIFKKLKNLLRGQNETSLNTNLKNSAGFRESLEQGLVKISDALLDTSVLKGRRDVIRKRAETRGINPGRG